MTTQGIYEKAVEFDDPFHDNTCPGCHQNITGWEKYEGHYPPGVRPIRLAPHDLRLRTSPMPFTDSMTGIGPDVCPWTRDYLSARAHRRALIREGVTT